MLPIEAVLHLEFSVVDGRSGERGSGQIQFTKKRERKEIAKRRRESEVTDGERETVLKSPASVQKLDSPRLDGTRRDARLPAGESTSETSVRVQACV